MKKYGKLSKEIEAQVQSYFGKFKWPWDGKRIRNDVAEIRASQDSFKLMLSVMQKRDLEELKQEAQVMEAAISGVKEMIAAQEGRALFQTCINWLPSNETKKNREMERKNSRNSKPSWILQDPSYRQWVSGKTSDERWLWALGEPGTGKTCLASFLADTLEKSALEHENDGDLIPRDTQDVMGSITHGSKQINLSGEKVLPDEEVSSLHRTGVAIFFCSDKTKGQQDPTVILKCLARQLLLQLQDYDPQRAWTRIHLVNDMMTSEMLDQSSASILSLLEKLVLDFKKSCLIIDALDENASEYENLLAEFRKLSPPSLKIFTTSRDGHDGSMVIRAKSYGTLQLHVHPEDSSAKQAKLSGNYKEVWRTSYDAVRSIYR